MYFPDLRYQANLERSLKEHARLQKIKAILNAKEAYDKKYGSKAEAKDEIDEAQWQEIKLIDLKKD